VTHVAKFDIGKAFMKMKNDELAADSMSVLPRGKLKTDWPID